MGVPLTVGKDAGEGADIYLHVKTAKAGELKGESTAEGHVDAVIAHGFEFGLAASSAIGSGMATSRRQYQPLIVYKKIDSGSTRLMSALATNDEVKELRLCLRKPGEGQDDFFTITLGKARVTGVELTCDAKGEAQERVAFTFTEITVEYRVQAGAGHLGATSTFDDSFGSVA